MISHISVVEVAGVSVKLLYFRSPLLLLEPLVLKGKNNKRHDPQGHGEYNSVMLDLKSFFIGFSLNLFRSVYF